MYALRKALGFITSSFGNKFKIFSDLKSVIAGIEDTASPIR